MRSAWRRPRFRPRAPHAGTGAKIADFWDNRLLVPSWAGPVPATPTICAQIVDVAVQRSIRKLFCVVPTWMPVTSTGMTEGAGLNLAHRLRLQKKDASPVFSKHERHDILKEQAMMSRLPAPVRVYRLGVPEGQKFGENEIGLGGLASNWNRSISPKKNLEWLAEKNAKFAEWSKKLAKRLAGVGRGIGARISPALSVMPALDQAPMPVVIPPEQSLSPRPLPLRSPLAKTPSGRR